MGEQTGTQSHSALRIVAACQSSAEFVAAYSRYCEGRSLFIATKTPKPIGHIVKFKIALASGEHLLTGVGPVVEIFKDRENRFNRPGMRVEVEKLDASGRHWMEQLRARSGASGGAGAPRVVSAPTGMFATIGDDAAASGGAGAPRVVSAATGMFATIGDDAAAGAPTPAEPSPPAPVAASNPIAEAAPVPVALVAPAPVVAPPILPPARDPAPVPVPVPVADNLSAGWELDGLPEPMPLPRSRAATAPPAARGQKNGEKVAAKNGEKVAAKNGEKVAAKNGESAADSSGEKPQAVVASGELDIAPPLPPPPSKGGRSKRITFPALMFNKPRGLAVPAPSGAVVPKPLALLPSTTGTREGKLRPPTAPIEREPGAPVAPLGTPSDTEPHVMVPREAHRVTPFDRVSNPGGDRPVGELESSLARSHPAAAEGTPPPPASAAEDHPDITDAPPETLVEPDPVQAPPTPDRPRSRSKASTTTPPPVWTERTVTQTLHALVGGKPDPKVQEETIHWTNPGFTALTRPPTAPEVDIVEDEVSSPIDASAVPLVVGVEITSDVMDKTIISPPPVASRARLVIVMLGAAAACVVAGYYLGLRQGVSIEKLPVPDVAAASASAAGDKETWVVQCAPPAEDSVASVAPAPAGSEEAEKAETPPRAAEQAVAEVSPPESSRVRAPAPPAAAPSSPSSCYLNAMTSPVGATVLIDNKVGGRTPLRSKVACGRHSVRFEMENFQAATRSVTVRRGETEKVSAELSRPRAVLRIESTPSGATVLINGSSVGLTPLTTTVPGFVTSNLTLSKSGYKTVARQINPTSTSARIGVTFKPDGRRSSRR